MQNDNPFAKSQSLSIGKEVAWSIDKEAVLATKSASDKKGTYYHLQFDNKQIKLIITSDEAGLKPKKFSQFEIKDVKIDNKQSALFKWCLNNQEKHSRFLQQDLTVKKGICTIDANAGTFIMQLDMTTLTELKKGSRLLIELKPFRTPLELKYDISDFDGMYVALNARPAPVIVAAPNVPVTSAAKLCQLKPPEKYKNIKSLEYKCIDVVAKANAEGLMDNLVSQEKIKQEKLVAEKEKQNKLLEEKKQKELAAKLKQEEKLRAEAAVLAASKAKQAQLGDEITTKMISMCSKFWDKGEHRCYCEKYIEYAPGEIQANSSCK